MEQEAAPAGGTAEAVYTALRRHEDAPETLAEEVELFRVLHSACRCYDLNTILARDPQVHGLKEAVAQTMDLIAYALGLRQGGVRLTLEDYREALTASQAST